MYCYGHMNILIKHSLKLFINTFKVFVILF